MPDRVPTPREADPGGLVTQVPAGYLAVAALDEVSGRELAARRAWLLGALGSAAPGEVDGVLAVALALVAVAAEQDTRARIYRDHEDDMCRCACGFECWGLAGLDEHLDQFPLDEDAHYEAGRTRAQDRQDQPCAGGDAELDGLGAGRVSPVFTGGDCFELEGRPHVLRMELPVSAEEMVAALYGEHGRLQEGDLETDEDIWRKAAIMIILDGLPVIEERADQILVEEARNALFHPEWLALCRRRVAEVTGEDIRPRRLVP
jgi:hypothetical protein